ncbi:MAG: hypothetical protein V7K26_02095 [Nostoc sp.]|uniref:hypothetical protein n=1 Tax=Nostoc sp. TaxID=1180 RepID=UPI002FF1124F
MKKVVPDLLPIRNGEIIANLGDCCVESAVRKNLGASKTATDSTDEHQLKQTKQKLLSLPHLHYSLRS